MAPRGQAGPVRAPLRPLPGQRPGGGPSHEGEEICHIVTEDDPDTALCGKDVSGYPWNPPWPMCVVCVDLAQHDARQGPA